MKPAHLAVLVSFVAAVLLLIAGPGTRMDWWAFGTGFQLMRWAAYVGLAGAALAAILALVPRTRQQGVAPLLLALVLGLGVAAVPWSGLQHARSVPPIHDISTDTERPPAFVAILPLRADAPNPAEYGGAEIAAQQHEAYPDLGTRHLQMPASEAFKRAEKAAREMGWEIVAMEPREGRLEATDTTRWFGFKDDVVVRIEPDGDRARLDVRSVSRVGESDVGANAARIRAYLTQVGGTVPATAP